MSQASEIKKECSDAMTEDTGNAVDDIMLREPCADPLDHLSEEERAKIVEILRTLDPADKPAAPPPFDLREHFKKGETIRDPGQGVTMHVLTIGAEAMRCRVVGRKARFVDGYQVNISGHALVSTHSKGKETTFRYMGPALPDYMRTIANVNNNKEA